MINNTIQHLTNRPILDSVSVLTYIIQLKSFSYIAFDTLKDLLRYFTKKCYLSANQTFSKSFLCS